MMPMSDYDPAKLALERAFRAKRRLADVERQINRECSVWRQLCSLFESHETAVLHDLRWSMLLTDRMNADNEYRYAKKELQ